MHIAICLWLSLTFVVADECSNNRRNCNNGGGGGGGGAGGGSIQTSGGRGSTVHLPVFLNGRSGFTDNGNGRGNGFDNGNGNLHNGNGDNGFFHRGNGDNEHRRNGNGDNGFFHRGNGDNGHSRNGNGNNGFFHNGNGDNGLFHNGNGDNGFFHNGNGNNGIFHNGNGDNGFPNNGGDGTISIETSHTQIGPIVSSTGTGIATGTFVQGNGATHVNTNLNDINIHNSATALNNIQGNTILSTGQNAGLINTLNNFQGNSLMSTGQQGGTISVDVGQGGFNAGDTIITSGGGSGTSNINNVNALTLADNSFQNTLIQDNRFSRGSVNQAVQGNIGTFANNQLNSVNNINANLINSGIFSGGVNQQNPVNFGTQVGANFPSSFNNGVGGSTGIVTVAPGGGGGGDVFIGNIGTNRAQIVGPSASVSQIPGPFVPQVSGSQFPSLQTIGPSVSVSQFSGPSISQIFRPAVSLAPGPSIPFTTGPQISGPSLPVPQISGPPTPQIIGPSFSVPQISGPSIPVSQISGPEVPIAPGSSGPFLPVPGPQVSPLPGSSVGSNFCLFGRIGPGCLPSPFPIFPRRPFPVFPPPHLRFPGPLFRPFPPFLRPPFLHPPFLRPPFIRRPSIGGRLFPGLFPHSPGFLKKLSGVY